MSIEEAIKLLESGSQFPDFPHTADMVDEACEMAVAALRAQQKTMDRSRWSGCQMCTTEYKCTDWADGGAHDFRIHGDVLYCFDAQLGWEGTHVKYCPFCGRPLADEAWAELERKIGGSDDA